MMIYKFKMDSILVGLAKYSILTCKVMSNEILMRIQVGPSIWKQKA